MDKLARALERLTNDQRYAVSAAKVAEHIARDDGIGRAAETIERIFERRASASK